MKSTVLENIRDLTVDSAKHGNNGATQYLSVFSVVINPLDLYHA